MAPGSARRGGEEGRDKTHCIQSAPHASIASVSVAREERSAARREGQIMALGRCAAIVKRDLTPL